MERTERVILTNMCMIRSGTKVLVEEKITPEGKGIIFPGGHVEEHEPVVDSVIREMQEETGLTIEKPELCGTDRFTGKVTSSSEGRVFWMEMDEVLNTNWIWGMDDLMRIFRDGAFAELFLDSSDGWKQILK